MQRKHLKLHSGKKTNGQASLAKSLNTLLADTYTLYLKTQYYHWNVTGIHFQSLHTLFEAQYTELAEAVDVLAERIKAIGYHAPGSFEAFTKLKTIEEGDADLDAESMILDLANSHEQVCKSVLKVSADAEKLKDDATKNIMDDRLVTHQKTIWMLRSHLG